MATRAEPSDRRATAQRFEVQHPVSAYTFPREARIEQARFDAEYLHVDLEDGRRLSVPLHWIPTLAGAPPEEREKYEINASRTMLVWDPARCSINEELSITDYLSPGPRRS